MAIADNSDINIVNNKEEIKKALILSAKQGLHCHYIRTNDFNYTEGVYAWLKPLGYDIDVDNLTDSEFQIKISW